MIVESYCRRSAAALSHYECLGRDPACLEDQLKLSGIVSYCYGRADVVVGEAGFTTTPGRRCCKLTVGHQSGMRSAECALRFDNLPDSALRISALPARGGETGKLAGYRAQQAKP